MGSVPGARAVETELFLSSMKHNLRNTVLWIVISLAPAVAQTPPPASMRESDVLRCHLNHVNFKVSIRIATRHQVSI